jgi:hypothetical protein
MANFHIEALIPMSELEKLFALVHHLWQRLLGRFLLFLNQRRSRS